MKEFLFLCLLLMTVSSGWGEVEADREDELTLGINSESEMKQAVADEATLRQVREAGRNKDEPNEKKVKRKKDRRKAKKRQNGKTTNKRNKNKQRRTERKNKSQ